MPIFEKNNKEDVTEKINKLVSAVNTLNKKINALEQANTEYEKQNAQLTATLKNLEEKNTELERRISFIYDTANTEKVSAYLEKLKKATAKIELLESISGDSELKSTADTSQNRELEENYGIKNKREAEVYVKDMNKRYKDEINKLDSIIETPFEDISAFEYSEISDGIRIDCYKGGEKNVIVPDFINNKPVTEIGNESFYNCRVIKSIKLPSELKRIGLSAFYGTSLECIKIPEGVTEIGSNALNIYTLGHAKLPDSVQEIAENTFFKSFFGYNVTIYCKSGSYAIKYAGEHNMKIRPYKEFDMLL